LTLCIICFSIGSKIPDALWAEKAKPKGGRSRMSNRKAMDARFYILGTGCQWKAGVFHRIWRVGLEKYDEWKKLDCSWQSMDGAMTKAPLSGKNRA